MAGIVLAGGRGSRMGGVDKALLMLDGRPLIAQVIDRMGCARAISANGDPARFASFGLPVLPDPLPDFPGPLAGILAGLDWAAAHGVEHLVALIRPENVASQGVARNLGMQLERTAHVHGTDALVLGMRLGR